MQCIGMASAYDHFGVHATKRREQRGSIDENCAYGSERKKLKGKNIGKLDNDHLQRRFFAIIIPFTLQHVTKQQIFE